MRRDRPTRRSFCVQHSFPVIFTGDEACQYRLCQPLSEVWTALREELVCQSGARNDLVVEEEVVD
jgi:hypothetical protein